MIESEKSLKIRNSTAEFLMFAADSASDSIEVMVADENVWLTQDMIATLYDKGRSTITEHLKNIYSDGELDEESTRRNFRRVASNGKEYNMNYYSLEAVIAVGFRTNSERAIIFRNWASGILKDFSIRGYVLDKERLKNGAFLNEEYYDHLLDEIREIRASERRFYQKITDIYATAMDYSREASITKTFFKTVQNKLHFAIHGKTASEIDGLNSIITMYLDYAENQAKRKIPMTMEDWANKLNAFLQFNEYEILNNAGKVTAEIAKAFAESEFEKYRIIQDRLFESDFDKFAKGLIE